MNTSAYVAFTTELKQFPRPRDRTKAYIVALPL